MSLGLGKIQAVENTFCIRIPDWWALSGHIWKKYHSIAPRGYFFCDFIKLIQWWSSCLFFHHTLIVCKFMFKPAHDSTASGSSSLKEPLARNNMITEDQPWISFVLICTNAHSPGLSSLFLCFSCMDHTSSKRSACSIKSTGNNRCSLGKSTLCCCLRGDSAYHMITVTYFRKESHRNSKLFTHLFIPASFFHIKTM